MLVTTHRTFASAIAVAITSLLFAAAQDSQAVIVGAQSYGDELAGAKITVNFDTTGARDMIIGAGAPQQGLALDAGWFRFSVTGDTFLADWTLDNLSNESINSVLFDLSGSNVLFDDGSLPDTPNSYAGRAGAVQVNVSPPDLLSSGEFTLWPDVDNAGDEYLEEFIEFANFRPGFTAAWRDDTDIIGKDTGPEVPEPSTMILALGALIGCGVYRKCRK